MHELKNAFRPEFLNRIDEIIVFKSLTEDEIVQIVDLMVAELRERMIAQNDDHQPGRRRQTPRGQRGH